MGLCLYDLCKISASFNVKGNKGALYCKRHAQDRMVGVKRKFCSHDACMTHPYYNFKGITTAMYCKRHAKDGMVNVVYKRCVHSLCESQANFNVPGSKLATYCKQHDLGGMVNVRKKPCMHDCCQKRPLYDFDGSKTPVYCKQHAEDGMVNVNNKRCLYDSCTKHRSFNLEGMKTLAYCKLHAADGMVNVRQGRVSKTSRTARAATEVPSNGVATACIRHDRRSWDFSTTIRRKRSPLDFDGNMPSRCLDHGPFNPEVGATVGLNATTEGPHTSSSVLFKRFVEIDTAGMKIEPSGHDLSPSVSQPGDAVVSEEPIKSEVGAAVFF